MAFRFRKSFGSGARLTVGKRSLGASLGVKGARASIGKRGLTLTGGIPGTGLSWSRSFGGKRRRRTRTSARDTAIGFGGLVFGLLGGGLFGGLSGFLVGIGLFVALVALWQSGVMASWIRSRTERAAHVTIEAPESPPQLTDVENVYRGYTYVTAENGEAKLKLSSGGWRKFSSTDDLVAYVDALTGNQRGRQVIGAGQVIGAALRGFKKGFDGPPPSV